MLSQSLQLSFAVPLKTQAVRSLHGLPGSMKPSTVDTGGGGGGVCSQASQGASSQLPASLPLPSPLQKASWQSQSSKTRLTFGMHRMVQWSPSDFLPSVVVQSLSHIQLLCDPMDHGTQSSSVYGISQVTILGCVVFPSPRDFPGPGIELESQCLLHCRSIFYH